MMDRTISGILLLAIVGFTLKIFAIILDTKCKNCEKYFVYRCIKSETIYDNGENKQCLTHLCENCGYKEISATKIYDYWGLRS